MLRRSRSLLLPCAVLCAVATSGAQSRFFEPTRPPMPVDNGPEFKVAVGDVNGDGLPDLACANMGSTLPGTQNSLYLNDGFGGFRDVTATNLPQLADWSGAVALGDVDRDGDLDLVFGNASSQQHRLYLNDGSGRFTDATATHFPAPARTAYACAMLDVDGDGDLDVFLREVLMLNDGTGHFTDVTSAQTPSTPVGAWGMATGDLDQDGDQDVMFGVPNSPPVLWLNDGTGRFSDASGNRPAVQNTVRGDFSLGDVDGDGDLDAYIQGYASQNILLLNQGQAVFVDGTANLPSETDYEYTSQMADVDLDGDLDVVAFNGTNVTGQTKLYLNDGTGTFSDATSLLPSAILNTACGKVADLDLDGDPDLVLANWNAQNVVWLNLHRHTYAPSAPAIGAAYAVDVTSRPGYATQPSIVLPFVGFLLLPRPLALPGLGHLTMDPSTAVAWPAGSTTLPTGAYRLSLTVPNAPALVGGALYWQALVVDGTSAGLTNTFPDRVR